MEIKFTRLYFIGLLFLMSPLPDVAASPDGDNEISIGILPYHGFVLNQNQDQFDDNLNCLLPFDWGENYFFPQEDVSFLFVRKITQKLIGCNAGRSPPLTDGLADHHLDVSKITFNGTNSSLKRKITGMGQTVINPPGGNDADHCNDWIPSFNHISPKYRYHENKAVFNVIRSNRLQVISAIGFDNSWIIRIWG